jgi:SAM-dependent methyltransferase
MTSNFYHRNNCRLCFSAEVVKVFDMPLSQPVDNFRSFDSPLLHQEQYPMDLYQCQDCGHVQLLDVVSSDVLYSNYIYTSSSSPDLLNHFTSYAAYLDSFIHNFSSKRILDVGCNDGLFLSCLSKYSQSLSGIDPAPNVYNQRVSEGFNFYAGYLDRQSLDCFGALCQNSFDVITANNVFSHADNLNDMLDSICYLLADDGYFCFEVSYLLDLVESKVIDYVYHEHLAYHSILPLRKFLARHGLNIIDIVRVSTKGGSIRVLCSKVLPECDDVNTFIAAEMEVGCYQLASYHDLSVYINKAKHDLQDILPSLLSRSSIFFSYGACATSIVHSLLFDYSTQLDGFLDDNNLRQNLLSPNSHVPIHCPSILADYNSPLVIIGAWRFFDQIFPKIKSINPSAIVIHPSLTEGLKLIH